LKENVIVGRLVPAGTGLMNYRDTFVIRPDEPEPVEAAVSLEPGGEEKELSLRESLP
jgi:hypothetical protein